MILRPIWIYRLWNRAFEWNFNFQIYKPMVDKWWLNTQSTLDRSCFFLQFKLSAFTCYTGRATTYVVWDSIMHHDWCWSYELILLCEWCWNYELTDRAIWYCRQSIVYLNTFSRKAETVQLNKLLGRQCERQNGVKKMQMNFAYERMTHTLRNHILQKIKIAMFR